MARFSAFAACCLCLAMMSGAMAARDLRGYGATPPTYTPSPSPSTYQPTAPYYQPSPYSPPGTAYPICTLSPPPFEVNNVDKSPGYGDFSICFELSAKGYNGYDLAALQLVVSDKCYDEVSSVTFGGKKYEPELTKYTSESNIGVKIGDKSLVTFKSLYTPVKVCITLKGACANADSLYNTITYFPVYSAKCATTSLWNPPTPPHYSYSPSTYVSYPPKYTPSPSPVYESPSPVYYPSPSPVYESYPSPSPKYTPSPSPVYESPSPVYYPSPSPVYESYPSPSPKYESPSPVYYSSPKYTSDPAY